MNEVKTEKRQPSSYYRFSSYDTKANMYAYYA